jgi:hypothetical protein
MPPKKHSSNPHARNPVAPSQRLAATAGASLAVPAIVTQQPNSASSNLHRLSAVAPTAEAAGVSKSQSGTFAEHANSAAFTRIAPGPPSRSGVIGNAVIKSIIRGEIEAPAGVADMGGWRAAAYTSEQQMRLHVDALGNKIASEPARALKSPSPESRHLAKWEPRLSAFSLQKYFLNVAESALRLEDPYESSSEAGAVADSAPAPAPAPAIAGSPAPASPASCQNDSESMLLPNHNHPALPNSFSDPLLAVAAPHDAEPSWPPRDAKPQVFAPVSRVYFASTQSLLQWDSHEINSSYLPDHRCEHSNAFLQSITINSPICTFTSAPGADLNAFLMMAGAETLADLRAALLA